MRELGASRQSNDAILRAMRAFLVLPLALLGCGDDGAGECDPTREPCAYERTLSTVTVDPGEEIDGLCQSWTLDNPTELWVGNVTMDNGGVYHHSNWFFVPDNLYDRPDGAWPCDDAAFDELSAAVSGGYLFAQSTQVEDQQQVFPDGVGVRIPPWSKIVGSTHLLNASAQAVETHMTIGLETIPPAELETKLVPARIEFNALTIDPMATSSFTTECDFAAAHEEVVGAPLAYDIYYALPHYHELGIRAELALAGGPRDGEVVFRTDGFGEASGVAFDPPIDVAGAGAHGLRFTCTFDNPRSEEVGWGIGDQEMCVIALFADSAIAFQGNARSSEVTGTAADGTVEHTGPCQGFGILWDHDKPGGPER